MIGLSTMRVLPVLLIKIIAADEYVNLLVLQRMSDVRTPESSCDAGSWYANAASNNETRLLAWR